MDSIQKLIREMVSDADIIDDENEPWYDVEGPISYDDFVKLIWEIYEKYAEDRNYEDDSSEALTAAVEIDLIKTLRKKFGTHICDYKTVKR